MTVASGPPTFIIFNSDSCTGAANEVNSLEHVQVLIDMEYPRRGFLDIYLKSPAGMLKLSVLLLFVLILLLLACMIVQEWKSDATEQKHLKIAT